MRRLRGLRMSALVACLLAATLTPLSTARADGPDGTAVCGTLPAGTTTWIATASPYVICDAGLIVGPGSSLLVDTASPGSVLVVDGGSIDIEGGTVTTVSDSPDRTVFFGSYVSSTVDSFAGFDVSENPDSPVSHLSLTGAYVDSRGAPYAVRAAGNAVVVLTASGLFSGVLLAGHATAVIDSDYFQFPDGSSVSLLGDASALVTRTSLAGGGQSQDDAAITIDDSARFNAECDTMYNAVNDLRTTSSVPAVIESSDLTSVNPGVQPPPAGWFLIAGSGMVKAEHDAWSFGRSAGPTDSEFEHPSRVDTAHYALSSSPRGLISVAGPTTSRDGVRGAGLLTITLDSEIGLRMDSPPAMFIQDPHGTRHRLAVKRIGLYRWQARFTATPTTLQSGWSTVHARGGETCSDYQTMTPAVEVVHINDRPITPTLAAAAMPRSQTQVSWVQRGEQRGTTFALRTGVERSHHIRWRVPPRDRRLAKRHLVIREPRPGRYCYQVRATAFGTTSRWSRYRCLAMGNPRTS